MGRLLESHRLVLVLDLDHTLVNSVKFSEVDAEWEYKLEQQVAQQVCVCVVKCMCMCGCVFAVGICTCSCVFLSGWSCLWEASH